MTARLSCCRSSAEAAVTATRNHLLKQDGSLRGGELAPSVPQPPRAGRLTTSLPASLSLRMHRRNVSVNSSPSGGGSGMGALGYRGLGQLGGAALEGGGVGWRKRQGEREDGPLVGDAALDREASAVTLSQLAADEKAEPGTGHVTELWIAGPMESLEDPFPLALGNAGTIVRDPDDRPVCFGQHTDRQLRLASGVGEAVIDQVIEDASQLLLIRVDRYGIGRQDRRNLGTEQVGSGAGPFTGVLNDSAKVQLVMAPRHRLGLDARRLEEVGHDAVQLTSLSHQGLERFSPRIGHCPEGAIRQHRQIANDDRDRRSQFVGRHVEEACLLLIAELRRRVKP